MAYNLMVSVEVDLSLVSLPETNIVCQFELFVILGTERMIYVGNELCGSVKRNATFAYQYLLCSSFLLRHLLNMTSSTSTYDPCYSPLCGTIQSPHLCLLEMTVYFSCYNLLIVHTVFRHIIKHFPLLFHFCFSFAYQNLSSFKYLSMSSK